MKRKLVRAATIAVAALFPLLQFSVEAKADVWGADGVPRMARV